MLLWRRGAELDLPLSFHGGEGDGRYGAEARPFTGRHHRADIVAALEQVGRQGHNDGAGRVWVKAEGWEREREREKEREKERWV
jgi:hypothetical protein